MRPRLNGNPRGNPRGAVPHGPAGTAAHGHVLPVSLYLTVFGALLVLAGLTLTASYLGLLCFFVLTSIDVRARADAARAPLRATTRVPPTAKATDARRAPPTRRIMVP